MARNPLKGTLATFSQTHRILLGVNADNPEMIVGISKAVRETKIPLFVQVTPETLALWGYDVLTAIMKTTLDSLETPVSWHLDHATALNDIKQALDWGFTSVMYDGSTLPFEDNIRNTQRVVEMALAKGALVEGEIGHVHKPGEPEEWRQLTDPDDVVAFVQATHVDALAIAIGNHHATHVKDSQIDLDRLAAIQEVCSVPLVLHGASGVPVELYDALRNRGIVKMNFGTELRSIWWKTVHEMQNSKPRWVQSKISTAIDNFVKSKLSQLS